MDDQLSKLVALAELQLQASAKLQSAHAELLGVVREQADHNAALLQCVAMLLGEELGTPEGSGAAQDADRTDLDGRPY